MSRWPYTTAFGAIIDQEIADALRGGMSLDAIAAELMARYREVAIAAYEAHRREREVKPCCAG